MNNSDLLDQKVVAMAKGRLLEVKLESNEEVLYKPNSLFHVILTNDSMVYEEKSICNFIDLDTNEESDEQLFYTKRRISKTAISTISKNYQVNTNTFNVIVGYEGIATEFVFQNEESADSFYNELELWKFGENIDTKQCITSPEYPKKRIGFNS